MEMETGYTDYELEFWTIVEGCVNLGALAAVWLGRGYCPVRGGVEVAGGA